VAVLSVAGPIGYGLLTIVTGTTLNVVVVASGISMNGSQTTNMDNESDSECTIIVLAVTRMVPVLTVA
jgi:hypothetical protein